MTANRRVRRPIRIEGDVAYIPLTRGFEALIDAADVPLVQDHNWYVWEREHKTPTAITSIVRADGKRRAQVLSRHLLSPPTGMQVDHKDGNALDNRRSNLRVCTPTQNAQNRRRRRRGAVIGYVGVSAWGEKWKAEIEADGARYYLGIFDSAEEAAAVRDDMARQLHGEFAVLNFPD